MNKNTDWKALSESLTLHGQAYIDGSFRPALSGETYPSINPTTEQVLVDVEVAVASGLQAFRCGRWSEAAPGERKRVLLRLADLVAQYRDEFALLDTLDMGKSISETTGIDVPDVIDCLRWR